MPRQYSLSGGAGQLIVPEQDPLEVAYRRAQLEDLLQKPSLERAQLALQRRDQELKAATAAGQLGLGTGQLGLDTRKLEETLPIERGKLTVDQQRAAAEEKFRTGSLAEETRFHTATNEAEKARVRAGLVGDVMTHMLPSELSGQLPKGSVEAAYTALGAPELASSMKSMSNRAMLQKAIAFADQSKTLNEKQFGAAAAGLPPGTEPEFVNAAWNRYKSTHPDIYGKDVVTAAETALKPEETPPTTPATTTPATTTGNYVAPAAGSPSVGWAMGPDSPLASTTPGLSQLGPLKPQMGLVDPKTNEVLPLPGRETAPAAKPPPVDQLVKAAGAQYPEPIGPPTAPTAAALPPPINPNVRPPSVDVDKLLQNVVGGPSKEELERRRRSQQAAVLTPFRTNQY
jgi:hypothetical protein